MERRAQISRKTNETDINLSFNIDGAGVFDISTGIGFFDHMLSLFAKHGFFDIDLTACGDLNVDCHHTIEDTGICLGAAIKDALGDKSGVIRYGHSCIPMDETLILCAVDLSGRAYLDFDISFNTQKIGDMETETIEEFFRAVARAGGLNLHFILLNGKNAHHIAEGIFKAFARALDMASAISSRSRGIPSTKGAL